MKHYRIITPYGNTYTIDQDGCFVQYNEHVWKHPHNTWKCRGVYEIIAFGQWRFLPLQQFINMIESGHRFTFKNGKPRYTIADLDHGTARGWGNTEHHGIKSAWEVKQ